MKSYTVKIKLSQKDIQDIHSRNSILDDPVFKKIVEATQKQVQDYENILSDQQKCHLLTSAYYKDSRSEINPDYVHLTNELRIIEDTSQKAREALWAPFCEKENRELKAILTENKIPEGYWPSQIRPISPEYLEKENETGE